jgi:hypothetical protein
MALVFTTTATDALNAPPGLLVNDGTLKSIDAGIPGLQPCEIINSYCTASDPDHLFGALAPVIPFPTNVGRWIEIEIAKFEVDQLNDTQINIILLCDTDAQTTFAGFQIYGGFFDVNQQFAVNVTDSGTNTYDDNPPPENPNGYYGYVFSYPYTPQVGDRWKMAVISNTWWLYLNDAQVGTGTFSNSAISNTSTVLLLANSDELYDMGVVNYKAGTVVNTGAYSIPDDRNYGTFPNNSRTVQGTEIYDVSAHPSTIPPVDSRAAGAPVDSRVASIIPQNSRVAP